MPRIARFIFTGDDDQEGADRQTASLAGMAVIQCALAVSGRLSDCSLLADGPLDEAYGEAAMKMARDGYLTAQPPPTSKDGDEVRVIVSFPRPSN